MALFSFNFCFTKFLVYRLYSVIQKTCSIFKNFTFTNCTFYLQVDTLVKLWICVDLALVDPLVLLGHVPMCTSTPIVYSEHVLRNISRIFSTGCLLPHHLPLDAAKACRWSYKQEKTLFLHIGIGQTISII